MGLSNPGPAWLFCPADRPERYQKAAAAADVVILDLEDGCAPADRPAARKALVDVQLDPARTVVRVNQFDTADQELDLQALNSTPYDTVMLPKCEAVEQISALAPLDVIVLVESPKGALIVTDTVQADNAVAVMWGAEDLFAVLGGTANRYPGRNISRGRPPRPFAVAAGGQSLRSPRTGFGLSRHQRPRWATRRGRRRCRGGLRRESCYPPQPGAGDPGRLCAVTRAGGVGTTRSRSSRR